jgi:hypothetical protein
MIKSLHLHLASRRSKYMVVLLAFFSLSFDFAPSAIKWTTSTDYDFGAVEFGTTSGVVFSFQNTSTDSVLLETVRTTCGCTAAEWPERPLAPGATGDLRIEFTAEHKGPFTKKIRVFFDAMRKPEILFIRGRVE